MICGPPGTIACRQATSRTRTSQRLRNTPPGTSDDAGYHAEYHRGMIITIDRAGRVVVPKTLRDRFNLTAGTKLEIKAAGDGLTLRRMGADTSLVRKHGILVHHGDARAALDVGEFIRAEREARIRRLTNDTD